MVCLGDEQRSFCRFWDCIQVLHFRLFCWPWWLLHFFFFHLVTRNLSFLHVFSRLLAHSFYLNLLFSLCHDQFWLHTSLWEPFSNRRSEGSVWRFHRGPAAYMWGFAVSPCALLQWWAKPSLLPSCSCCSAIVLRLLVKTCELTCSQFLRSHVQGPSAICSSDTEN